MAMDKALVLGAWFFYIYKMIKDEFALKTALKIGKPLIDPYDRKIDYLRVSVTDRCDFRCVYCMSEDMEFLPKQDLLTLEELDILCSSFIEMGVNKLRLTGGEPLVRRNIMWLIERLGRHLRSGALTELTLTTNGSQLEKYADQLYAAGVRRVNVSIDSLQSTKFKTITRWGRLEQVLKGLEAAKKAGLHLKINMVALKGVNEDELLPMLEFCHQNSYDLTFIEVMPMGDIGNETRIDQYLPLSMVRSRLAQHYQLESLPDKTAGPARYFRIVETGQRIGFITPLTHNFCESCNRVRVTCTGMLYMCLGQDDHADLKHAIRSGDMAMLAQSIRAAIDVKPKGHDFIIDRRRGAQGASRHMSTTGG